MNLNNFKKYKYHIIFILILSFIFNIVILLSSSQQGLNINYNFKDNITLNYNLGEFDSKSISILDSNIIIGNVEVNNSYILPKRVQLDNLFSCLENNNKINSGFHNSNLRYNLKGNYYSYYNNELDVDSKENKNISIVLNLNRLNLNDIYNSDNFSLYYDIYKLKPTDDDSRDFYTFCLDNEKSTNPIKRLKITLNRINLNNINKS